MNTFQQQKLKHVKHNFLSKVRRIKKFLSKEKVIITQKIDCVVFIQSPKFTFDRTKNIARFLWNKDNSNIF